MLFWGALLENQPQTKTYNNSIENVVTAQNYIQTTTWEDQQEYNHQISVKGIAPTAFHTKWENMGDGYICQF